MGQRAELDRSCGLAPRAFGPRRPRGCRRSCRGSSCSPRAWPADSPRGRAWPRRTTPRVLPSRFGRAQPATRALADPPAAGGRVPARSAASRLDSIWASTSAVHRESSRVGGGGSGVPRRSAPPPARRSTRRGRPPRSRAARRLGRRGTSRRRDASRLRRSHFPGALDRRKQEARPARATLVPRVQGATKRVRPMRSG